MNREQALQKEIEESRAWLGSENDDTIYRRDLKKRIEFIILILVYLLRI